MQLPEVEQLIQELAQQLKPHLTARSALVGIHTGGAWVAERLHQLLGENIPLGTLDISFYRDDFARIGLHPETKPSDIPFDVEGRDIILVDDVLYTGRTVRAAMTELFDYGRPSRILLAALVDRGGRELPIAAQAVGATLPLRPDQNLHLDRDEAGRLSLSLHEQQAA
ncbi:MAG: bifunctional pyr operon transcriptional regulator/uracil phosphoribosyltransferase PyrR [Pseudomonadota bacterium]